MATHNFKIVLVGDAGVGKTTLVAKLKNDEFIMKYIPTLGVEVHPVTFNSNHGSITFNVWDLAGQERYGGLRSGYYVGADACICMFDMTSKLTLHNTVAWIKEFKQFNPESPVFLCGNKSDIAECMPIDVITKHWVDMRPMFDASFISVKEGQFVELPFLQCARKLMNIGNLEFDTSPRQTAQRTIYTVVQTGLSDPKNFGVKSFTTKEIAYKHAIELLKREVNDDKHVSYEDNFNSTVKRLADIKIQVVETEIGQ